MIVLKGNRKCIESISYDFWVVWKGFIQHINHFNQNNNNTSNLLRDIDILIGAVLEKDINAADELKEALIGLSTIFHHIRVQITSMDTEFNHLNKMDFAVHKKRLEQLVVQARRNLLLVAADLKNVDFSRRKLIKTAGKAALGITITAGLGLSLQSDAPLLKEIVQALEQDNYDEVKRGFQSVSVPFTGQIKPTIHVEIPKYLQKTFQRVKQDPELKEELRQIFIESIRALRKGERFSEKESQNALTYIYNYKLGEQRGLNIHKKSHDSVGTSIFSTNAVSNAIKLKAVTIKGLIVSVYHGSFDAATYHLYLKNKEFLAPSINVLSFSKEYDLMLYLFSPLFEQVREKTGVRFTTSLTEGDDVYLLRYPAHPNYVKYGPMTKGRVLIYSYFHPNMKTVDLTITTLKTYGGDSGSPIFNKNGEVVGIHQGSLEYQTTKKKGSVTAFIRSEYVLKLLEETQRFFERELK